MYNEAFTLLATLFVLITNFLVGYLLNFTINGGVILINLWC